MTLQRRVLGYLALAAVVSCALTVGVAVVLLRLRVQEQRLSSLSALADALATGGAAPGTLSPGDHVYLFRARRGPVQVRSVRRAAVLAAVPPGGDSAGNVTVAGHPLIYAARSGASGRVIVIRSAHLAFAEWRPFLSAVVFAGLGAALLAVALSYLLARRLARPIDELSVATRRLATGEAGVAVPVRGEDELAQLGRAFNEMSGELGRARESQRSFLESVSHELKTPLTSIRGYAEALHEGAVSPSEGGRVIVEESGRLERLVIDLLDLARFGRADFAVARDPVELGKVAARAVERHGRQARELGLTLRVQGPAGGRALGDEDRLLQATSNLVENALRLTPAGGEVVVCTGPGEIAVRDTGPGLAPEELPRAFERFYLHGRYRSERAVGSGLGLAIVRELVAAMGGSVRASEAPGGGAEFVLTLPQAPAGSTPERSAPPDAVRPSA
ncbi:MAG: HAMP domain-containing histidine kinase [Actinomycetota bacterium]|nr:HAMP domain-containing histidine kinase [Actinomycetota bacterium]